MKSKLFLLPLDISRWLVEGRGRRGRPRGTGQAPPMFDQEVFTEAVGITAAAISQAGIAGKQEDPSNL